MLSLAELYIFCPIREFVCVLSCVSRVQLCVTVPYPLSMGFSRQECWSGFVCPHPGDPPNPGIEPGSSTLQVDSLPLSHQGKGLNLESVAFTGKFLF